MLRPRLARVGALALEEPVELLVLGRMVRIDA